MTFPRRGIPLAFAFRLRNIRRLVELGLKVKKMTSRDIATFFAILACVLVATALTGWLSMRAIDYFMPGSGIGI